MTGPLRRILRRRAAPPPLVADAPLPDAGEDAAPLPAGVDPEVALPARPSFRDRGRMRRRLRYLRRARELGFRDLGGLVFDLRRFGRRREDLVEAKVRALYAVDRELRALETALNARIPIHELREPGVTSCPHCGALHASDARFCPSCGTPQRGPRAVAEVGEDLTPLGLAAPRPDGGAAAGREALLTPGPGADPARTSPPRTDTGARPATGPARVVGPADAPAPWADAEPRPGADGGLPWSEAEARRAAEEGLPGAGGSEDGPDDRLGRGEAAPQGSRSLFEDPAALDATFLGGPGVHAAPDEPPARPDEPAPFPEDPPDGGRDAGAVTGGDRRRDEPSR
jgi:ribosomal protein L32